MTNLPSEERYQGLESANISLVECKQQLLDPIVWRVVEGIQDGVHQLGKKWG